MLETVFAALIEAVLQVAVWLTHCRQWVYSRLFVSSIVVMSEGEICSAVKSCSGSLNHIGAILENGEIDPYQVTYTATLMINVATEAVTIYQEKGNLVASVDHMVKLLESDFAVSLSSVCVRVKSEKGETVVNQTGRQSILLQILTKDQCARDFVNGAVRGIARDVEDGKLQVEEIDRSEISKRLFVQTADPEFVLCFAGPKRNGFLPWHIRVTEFLDAGKIGDFRLKDLLRLLRKFSKTEQRYGA